MGQGSCPGLICGVLTNIVVTADATARDSADSPYFVPFVKTAAQHFNVSEVSADKAYLSKRNLRAVEAVGGTAYIPFKSNSTGHQWFNKPDALWERTFHYYNLNRTEFLAHYHRRSNVEATFSMIKAKFGGRVRSKSPEAQINEVLLKILSHNVCVLIQSFYELGIEPPFGSATFETKTPVVPKMA